MTAIADSFTWPFRGPWRGRWAIGMVVVVLSPVLFVPLLGYAIAAVRAAENDASGGPPPWRLSAPLLRDGLLVAGLLAVSASPFAALHPPLATALAAGGLAHPYADVVAFSMLLLVWGLLALIAGPHAVARFSATRRARDLVNAAASVRSVTRDFTRWNLAAAAIVTAWAIGLACVGVLCVGLVPGVFYAILVSAHASATLASEPEAATSRGIGS